MVDLLAKAGKLVGDMLLLVMNVMDDEEAAELTDADPIFIGPGDLGDFGERSDQIVGEFIPILTGGNKADAGPLVPPVGGAHVDVRRIDTLEGVVSAGGFQQ